MDANDQSQLQLRMGFRRFKGLSSPKVPTMYGLRTFQPGDEDAWTALLSTGDFRSWDGERLQAMLGDSDGPLQHEGIFFATLDNVPIGSACIFLHPGEESDAVELGWVVVDPRHRGNGLAREIILAALKFTRALGHQYVYLLTEDSRLPAISTYLHLGFKPEVTDASEAARWDAVRRAISEHRPSPSPAVGRGSRGKALQ